MSNDDYTTEQLEKLAQEYAERTAAVSKETERIAEIKAIFLTLGEGKHAAGTFRINIKPGSKVLDSKKLTAAFPVTQFPHLYKGVIDTAAVKQHVAPADLDQYKRQNQPSVEVD